MPMSATPSQTPVPQRLDATIIRPKAVAIYERVYRETHSAAG